MQDKFPKLHEMGVTSPEQIISYDLVQTDPTEDMLRLKYQRPSGSFLPVTRVYRFARTPRAATSSAPGLVEYEMSPFLSVAMDELDTLVRSLTDRTMVLQQINDQIDQMERDYRGELKVLRAALRKLGDL